MKVFKENFISPFRLYVFLNFTTSGKFTLSKEGKKVIAKELTYKTYKAIDNNLKKLIVRNWIGYDKKSKVYFIRGFERIRKQEGVFSRSGAKFYPEYLPRFREFVSGVIIGWVINNKRRNEWKSVRNKRRTKPDKNSSSLFFPVACNGLKNYLKIPKVKAQRAKKQAWKGGFIDLKKNYEFLNVSLSDFRNLKNYHPEGEKIKKMKGKIYLQRPDLIKPLIKFKRRKKLEPYISDIKRNLY